jgi:hemerythrin-like domain-containing protein
MMMDPVRVKQILETVREDHELVAEQLRILEQLPPTIVDAEEGHLEHALDVLRGASRFFQTKLLPHFDEEEHGMFLLIRDRLPPGSTLIYELEAEHEQMRRLCERLREELGWLRHVKHRKQPILADLQSLCVRITELLRQHAEREDRLLETYGNLVGGADMC